MKNLSIILLSLFLISGISCKKEEKEVDKVRPVKVSKVKASNNDETNTFPCRAKFLKESKLSFRVPGNIKKINVNVGSKVKKGDVIAELDDKDYKIGLMQAEANLNNATHQLEMAENIYKRVKSLYINDNISKNDYDKSKSGYFSAKAMFDAAKKGVEFARNKVIYTKLMAPVDGNISFILVEVGENLGEFRPVCVLTTLGKVEVTALVPDTAIMSINIGDSAKVKFNVIENAFFDGTVTEAGVSSIGEGNTFMVTVELDNIDKRLKSGLIGEVIFKENNIGSHLIIPSSAVFADIENRYVFKVVEKNGKNYVNKTKIKIGTLTSQGFEVVKGLKEGEIVVTAGLNQIEDNMEVKLGKDLRL